MLIIETLTLIAHSTGEVIQRLISRGQAFLITGQNILFALELANRVYTLETGTIKWMGTMQEFWSHSEVLELAV